MSLWKGARRSFVTIRAELPKALLGGLGFLLALGINGLVERWHEQETFRSMLVALRAEATSNESVISDGYNKYFPEGVVLREFRTATAQGLLASPLFIKYLNGNEISVINKYVAELSLANSYRRAVEAVMWQSVEGKDGWLKVIKESLGNELFLVDDDIKAVIGINR